MSDRLSRQSFLGGRSDEVLRSCRVAIIGLGGGGSQIAQQLAHLGVGKFLVFDPDKVEESNLNRLVGATTGDAESGAQKTNVTYRLIRSINPDADVVLVAKPWQEDAELLRSCDVVFGCVDTYAARDEIERASRRFLIPYIDIGMDVTPGKGGFVVAGQVILSMPGGPCMHCLGFLNEDLLGQEAARYGVAGGHPQVIWPNGLLASVAVGVFTQLVTPWHTNHRTIEYIELDGNNHTLLTSQRLAYVAGKHCKHFPNPLDLGDPFWPPVTTMVS